MLMQPALRNPAGRGGPAAALARTLAEPALARVREVATSGTNPASRLAAARLLIRDPAHRPEALEVLGQLANDPRTPDAVVVEAAAMVLAATGRGRWSAS
jgi:hypothetical protein